MIAISAWCVFRLFVDKCALLLITVEHFNICRGTWAGIVRVGVSVGIGLMMNRMLGFSVKCRSRLRN